MLKYDIIIVGGGMVGASLASALRTSTLRIALIDAAPANTHDDPRLIALNYNSFCFLTAIGIWEKIAVYATAIEQVHVTDRGHFGAVRIKSNDLKLPTLGYVVPAKNINDALNETLKGMLDLFRPARLKKLSQTSTHATVVIETHDCEHTLTADLIIGADGTQSTVRKQLDITTEEVDYQQSALVTITQLNRFHENIAYERFQANGAIAMLPLTGQRCATIWTDNHATINERMQLNDVDFLELLQKTFGYRLGRLIKTNERHVYPLRMIKAKETIKQRVILIGNAAHTLSPIAAQGLNLAFAEVALLAEHIKQQKQSTKIPNWASYLSHQQKQQSISTDLSHRLMKYFRKDNSVLNLLRPFGMLGLDLCTPLKKRFALKAMGKYR